MVTLIDTSVWVSFLRGDGSRSHEWMKTRIRDPEGIVTTEPVLMELLAGARGNSIDHLETVLAAVPTVSVRPELDFRGAGILARSTRTQGLTVRSLVDCLIASVALRLRLEIAHRDADYAALARVAPLVVTDLR